MPGARARTRSQRTAPRWWWARTLEIDVKTMVDRQIRADCAVREDGGDKWHHHHAAANAQQTGQIPAAQPQTGKLKNQQGFKIHVGGVERKGVCGGTGLAS